MDTIFRLLFYSEQFAKSSSVNHTMTVLQSNLGRIADMSIDEIAEMCNTNAMTVSRTIRKLGYRSFAEFRAAADETVSQYRYMNRCIPMEYVDTKNPAMSFLDFMEQMISDLRESDVPAQIDAVCEVLHKAKKVHFYGTVFESIYTYMLLHDLIEDHKEVSHCTHKESILDDLDTIAEGSAIFLIPNELSTDTMVVHRVLEAAEERGVPLIMHEPKGSPLLSFSAGPNLTFPGNATASNTMCSQLVINMLIMTYRGRFLDS